MRLVTYVTILHLVDSSFSFATFHLSRLRTLFLCGTWLRVVCLVCFLAFVTAFTSSLFPVTHFQFRSFTLPFHMDVSFTRSFILTSGFAGLVWFLLFAFSWTPQVRLHGLRFASGLFSSLTCRLHTRFLALNTFTSYAARFAGSLGDTPPYTLTPAVHHCAALRTPAWLLHWFTRVAVYAFTLQTLQNADMPFWFFTRFVYTCAILYTTHAFFALFS